MQRLARAPEPQVVGAEDCAEGHALREQLFDGAFAAALQGVPSDDESRIDGQIGLAVRGQKTFLALDRVRVVGRAGNVRDHAVGEFEQVSGGEHAAGHLNGME
jgi:hypothetical protein